MHAFIFRLRRQVAVALCVGGAACASSGGRPLAPGTESSVLTADEIARSGATNAYDAVRKLRANFLASRGETSLGGAASNAPTAYVDGILLGEPTALRGIPAGQVASVRVYRAWEAQMRFGNGNLSGVIEVTTKRQ